MKIEIPFLRSPHNYDRAAASAETALECLDESLTVQSEKEDSDINVLVKRFGIGYDMPQGVRMPTYGDFTGLTTYQDAQNALMEADSAFAALPADVRYRFGNDPGQFVDFCDNEANRDEAIRLGLVPPPPIPPIPPTPPTPPAQSTPPAPKEGAV